MHRPPWAALVLDSAGGIGLIRTRPGFGWMGVHLVLGRVRVSAVLLDERNQDEQS